MRNASWWRRWLIPFDLADVIEAVEREMALHASSVAESRRPVVPSRFEVAVSSEDFPKVEGQLGRYRAEVEGKLRKFAELNGWTLQGGPTILFKKDLSLSPGEVQIEPLDLTGVPTQPRPDGDPPDSAVPVRGWCLLVDRKTRYPLDEMGVLRVGRAPDNDVVFEDASVSRKHAEFRCEDGIVRVEDLGSTGGTYARTEMIEAGQAVVLKVNDVVEIAEHSLVLKFR